MAKKDDDSPATKKDVEEIVGRVVGEIVTDALQLIDKRFDTVEKDVKGIKSDVKELKDTTGRIESKTGIFSARLDDHEYRLKLLEQKAS